MDDAACVVYLRLLQRIRDLRKANIGPEGVVVMERDASGESVRRDVEDAVVAR